MNDQQRQSIRFLTYSIPRDVDVLYRNDEVVPLEPVAVRVLRYLTEHHDRVVSKEELLENLWPDTHTTEGVLKRAVSQIRRTLGDTPAKSHFIATYHGRGYRFVAPANQQTASPGDAPSKPETARSPDFDQLTGREHELALLNAEYENCLRGRSRPVVLLGPAGIGKTQLARHFQKGARDLGALTIALRFFDYGGNQLAPYAPFIDVLAKVAGDESGEEPITAIRNRWGVELPSDALSENIGSRSRSGDPYSIIVPICRCFTEMARARPVVLVADDLQWATESDLDLISYLLRSLGELPLMMIGIAREEDLRKSDGHIGRWLRREAAYRSFTSIDVAPLTYESCRSAIRAVFGAGEAPEVPQQQFDAIFEVSGGNPYFLIEILRLLIADGVIERAAEAHRWNWRGNEPMELPKSLLLLAQARLERLPERVRSLIDAAAVVGDEFRAETLAQLVGKSEEETARLLEEAVSADVLSFRGLSTGEDCRFYHTIIRRAVYDQLPSWTRKALHSRTAQVLERVYAADPDRVVEAVSIHLERAEEFARSFDAALAASRSAGKRWEWQRALSCVERAGKAEAALEKAGHPVPSLDKIALGIAGGEALLSLGRLKEAEDRINATLRMAEAQNDSAAIADLQLLRGRTEAALSRYREASAHFEQASVIFSSLEDSAGESRARIELGGTRAAMGRYDESSRILREALQKMASDDDLASLGYGTLGWATALQGDYQSGAELLERAIESSDRSLNLRRSALLVRRLHWIELMRGRYGRSVELSLRAREQFQKIGDVAGEAKSIMGLGQVRIAQGRYDEAIRSLHETLERLEKIGDVHCHAETLWLLGKAHLGSGDLVAASPLLERALDLVREIGDRDDEFRVLTDIARLYLAEDRPEKARGAAADAVAIANELGNRDGAVLASCEQARACLLEHNLADGLALAREAARSLRNSQLAERWNADAVLGECLAAAGLPDQALPELERALDVIRAGRAEAAGDLTPIRSDFLAVAHTTERVLLDLGRRNEAEALLHDLNHSTI